MSLPIALRGSLLNKTDGHCAHCGKRLCRKHYGRFGAPGAWEAGHDKPASHGGAADYFNLWPLCIPCNRWLGPVPLSAVTDMRRWFVYRLIEDAQRPRRHRRLSLAALLG